MYIELSFTVRSTCSFLGADGAERRERNKGDGDGRIDEGREKEKSKIEEKGTVREREEK